MPYGGLLSAGISTAASLISSWLASNAAKDASQAQIDAVSKALDLQKTIYDRSYANSLPWIQQGGAAVNALGALMGLSPGTGDRSFAADGGGFLTLTPPAGSPRGNPGGSNSGTDTPKGPYQPAGAGGATPPPDGSGGGTDVPQGRFQPRGVMAPSLATIGTGPGAAQGGVQVRDPNGVVHSFATQVQAYSFAKQAGLA